MTVADNNKKKTIADLSVPIVIITAVLASCIVSDRISEYARNGVTLCYNVIIGSVFPFMILTDLMMAQLGRSENNKISSIFERMFNINGNALPAFICGALCGFPTGVRVANGLYTDGVINKDEYERLIGFSNNASPAFVISGIGAAMRGSIKLGIVLYVTMIASSVLVGFSFARGRIPSHSVADRKCESFVFTRSVKNATSATLNVCGFITVFSVICGLINDMIPIDELKYFIFPFLEVSNAAKILTDANGLSVVAKNALTSFAVSFSGISVHTQAKSFITCEGLSMKRYYLMKIISGILSALIASILTPFI